MNNRTCQITLRPIGADLRASAGTPLRDALFEQGMEFPCGGRGRCRGCRVQVLQGQVSINSAQRKKLSPEELDAGWRLACQCTVESDLVMELRQWDAAILADETPFAFEPRPGLGVAVDVGTTTIVAQLLDLQRGCVLGVRTALNGQGRHGADVMSRVEFALTPGGLQELQELIRRQIGALVAQLLRAACADAQQVRDVVLVGNTVMHHLFSGIDVEPLSRYPFVPTRDGLEIFSAAELGWETPGDVPVRFLPCLGGFVGSDLLAGILATRMAESDELIALIDLGTNGEIVLGNRAKILCASTAAGPAFEGARVSMGMRASAGAIAQVTIENGMPRFYAMGNVEAKGICGSGLVDAVAAGLDLGIILPSGRFSDGRSEWILTPPVVLTQADIRELQLAKAAIASGMQLLRRRWGGAVPARLYLAGAFGNYVSRASAHRIGLISYPPDQVQPAGNTALLGAKLVLFRLDGEDGSYRDLRRRVEHLGLSSDTDFQEAFVHELSFSDRSHAFQEDTLHEHTG
ncbi:MAG: ASKHA domain-containing protein [Deltaproteobacteria bacterium]